PPAPFRAAAVCVALGPTGADWSGAQHSSGAVYRRLRAVRQLSRPLSGAEPPTAGRARRALRRFVLRALYLWLAGRAMRRLRDRRDGPLVGRVRHRGAPHGRDRLFIMAPDREAVSLAEPRRGSAGARAGRGPGRLDRVRQALDPDR